MAVLFSTNPLVWKQTDGIYIAEQDVPGPVRIEGTTTCKMVGEFPWGPANEIVEINSPDDLADKLLGGYEDPNEYGGYRALKGKRFGPLLVVRPEADDAEKASIDIRDAAEVTVDTVDDSAEYEITITDDGDDTVYTYQAESGDAEAEILEGLADDIDADDDAVVAATVESGTMYVTGNGSESWDISGDADGTGALSTTDPTAAYTVEAVYTGAGGNALEVVHEQESADEFTLVVHFGTQDTEVLGPYSFDADGLEEASDESERVSLELHNDDGDNPLTRDNPVPLDGGDDGTLEEEDWTGTDNDRVGLKVLEEAQPGGMIFAAEHTSELWRQELREHADEMRAQAVGQASSSNDFDTNADECEAVADDRLSLCLHRVRQNVDGDKFTVDLAPFVAAVWSQIPPHYSVADWDNREMLGAISGLPDGTKISWGEWRKADEVGGITLERLPVGGWKIHAALTTDPDKPSMIRRRMTDIAGDTVGVALMPFQNKPAMESYVEDATTALREALEAMQAPGEPRQARMIDDFSVTVAKQTADTVIWDIAVKLHGEMRYLIANLTVGAGITIEEADAAA